MRYVIEILRYAQNDIGGAMLCQRQRANLYWMQFHRERTVTVMDIQFEIGDPRRPRGHALLYFRVDTEPDNLYGTYIVTWPITVDLTKYVPPFLASQLGSAGNQQLTNFSEFAMPPVPTLVEGGYDHFVRLANLRSDDLVYGGSMFSFDLMRMMESVSEAVQAYADAWAQSEGARPTPGPAGDAAPAGSVSTTTAAVAAPADAAAESDGMGVNEVLWSFMSEGDRLAEMARLVGRLRFAQEGSDASDISDITAEMTALGRQFPAEFNIGALLAAASDASSRGARLAQLYLDRCYGLSAGDAEQVRRLDVEIDGSLETG